MKIDKVKFAAELARSGLKSYELAQRAGLSVVTVSVVRTGKNCSKETANKVAAALGLPLPALLPDPAQGVFNG